MVKGDINNSKKFGGWLEDPDYLPEENMGDKVREVQLFSVPLVSDKAYIMAEVARKIVGKVVAPMVEIIGRGQ